MYYIPTISMSPTLNPGDYIIVNKFLYQFRTPEFYPFTNIPFPFFQTAGIQSVKRGHIIVFDSPLAEEGEHSALIMDIVKRCVGLPGDTLQIYPSKIIINGVKYNYDAVSSVGKDKRDKLIREIVIPKKGDQLVLTDSLVEYWENVLQKQQNTLEASVINDPTQDKIMQTKYRVKQNYYYVLGDNLAASSDSRTWGLLSEEKLIGKAVLKIWPWPPKWL